MALTPRRQRTGQCVAVVDTGTVAGLPLVLETLNWTPYWPWFHHQSTARLTPVPHSRPRVANPVPERQHLRGDIRLGSPLWRTRRYNSLVLATATWAMFGATHQMGKVSGIGGRRSSNIHAPWLVEEHLDVQHEGAAVVLFPETAGAHLRSS